MTLYKMVLKLDLLCVLCVRVHVHRHTHPETPERHPRVQFEKSLLGGMGRSVCWLQELRWAWEVGVGLGGWGGHGRLRWGSLEEEEAWARGAVTGQGLGSGTPTVRAAEAAGPAVTAEGHREGDHWVHTRWAAGEPDGGKAQLAVGAHWLGHRRQGSRQHPNLEVAGLRGRAWVSTWGQALPRAPSLHPTDPRLGCPEDHLCSPSHTPSPCPGRGPRFYPRGHFLSSVGLALSNPPGAEVAAPTRPGQLTMLGQ